MMFLSLKVPRLPKLRSQLPLRNDLAFVTSLRFTIGTSTTYHAHLGYPIAHCEHDEAVTDPPLRRRRAQTRPVSSSPNPLGLTADTLATAPIPTPLPRTIPASCLLAPHRYYSGTWGAIGSPPQKGIIHYGLSTNRIAPMAGSLNAAIFNTFRRTRGQILYWSVPLLIAYECMMWATEK